MSPPSSARLMLRHMRCPSALNRSIPSSSSSFSSISSLWGAVGSAAHTDHHRVVSKAWLSSLASSADSAEGGASGIAEKKPSALWRLVKAGVLLAFAGAVGGASYVTYAYDIDTVDKKVAELRSSKNVSTSEDTSILDKIRTMVYLTSLDAALSVAEFYLETRKNLEDQIRGIAAPSSSKLLPDLLPQEQGMYTLVLDLNETLVYSDWKRDRGWRTFKRPGVEAFLEQLAQHYELVIYSDQLSFYVEPVLERLDQKGCIRYRLSRDATQYINGNHLRDLAKLNRDPSHVIYLSAHAVESTLQPENALPIKSWKLEADDTVLLDLLPFLEFVARQRPGDIRPVLASYEGLDIPTEFRERTKEYQRLSSLSAWVVGYRKMVERKQQSRLWRGSTVSRPTS